MLTINIQISPEGWDEAKQEFVEPRSVSIQLEHSLISISAWESKWHKPFISKVPKTMEETIDYIKCMTLTKNVDPSVYYHLSNDNFKTINDYIDDPMTATTFNETNKKGSNEIITAEIIYYYMIELRIPVEFQKWHFNKLWALIKVCSIKNQPEKKMSKKDTMSNNAALNAARRKKYHTKG